MARTRAQAIELWTDDDWMVLYLDEINRFGDGFLDSLLSLTEEGKIVRRGEDYYVPMIVVATANPPGYDATAKKLSPPLQARIARSFRVAQPGFDDLVDVIIRPRLTELEKQWGQATGSQVPLDLARLAAAVTLCLWGKPDPKFLGTSYLTSPTRQLLTSVMSKSEEIRRSMLTLSTLITFGPDARAVLDWIGCAVGRAVSEKRRFSEEDLRSTAVEVLGHKVRETFNEGAEPAKSALKEYCVGAVTEQVFGNPKIRALFVPPLDLASRALAGAGADPSQVRQVLELSAGRLPLVRFEVWLRALAEVPRANPTTNEPDEASIFVWKDQAVREGALSPNRLFFSPSERDWVAELLQKYCPGKFANDVLEVRFESSELLRQLTPDYPPLDRFQNELCEILEDKQFHELLADDKSIRAWLSCLHSLLPPTRPDDHSIDTIIWRATSEFAYLNFEFAGEGPNAVAILMRKSLEVISNVANESGITRINCVLLRLDAYEKLPWLGAVARLAGDDKSRRQFVLKALLRVTDKYFDKLLQKLAPTRIHAFLQVLAALPNPTSPKESFDSLLSTNSVAIRGRFTSPAERAFLLDILETLRNLELSSPEVLTLLLQAQQMPFSSSSMIDAERGQLDRLDDKSKEAIVGALKALLDDRPIEELGRLGARMKDEEGAGQLVSHLILMFVSAKETPPASYFRAYEGIKSLTPSLASVGFSEAAADIAHVMAKVIARASEFGAVLPVLEPLRNELETFPAKKLQETGQGFFVDPDVKKRTPVGGQSVFKWLTKLLKQRRVLGLDMEGCLGSGLDVLYGCSKCQSLDELVKVATLFLNDPKSVKSFAERNWLAACCAYSHLVDAQKTVLDIDVNLDAFCGILETRSGISRVFFSTFFEELDRVKRPRKGLIVLTPLRGHQVAAIAVVGACLDFARQVAEGMPQDAVTGYIHRLQTLGVGEKAAKLALGRAVQEANRLHALKGAYEILDMLELAKPVIRRVKSTKIVRSNK